MIVAARAGNSETQERFRGHVDAVVDDVIRIAVEMIAEREETERRQRGLVIDGRKLVRRELFHDEAVVGLVVVERFDHIIAIRPGVGINRTLALAVELAFRIRVTRHVEPMASPAFAVMRRGQQLVHDLLERRR